MVLSVIGHGYVGLVTASVFADFGNTVWVIGRNPKKIENLKRGAIPFFEPGLEELVKKNIKAGHLKFTLDYKETIPPSEVVFIAVGTPSKDNGEADLSSVFDVAEKIAANISRYTVIATKSTVPPGTNRKLKKIIDKTKTKGVTADIVSIPEFLSQGTAIENTLHPDRVVIGTESKRARDLLLRLHKPIGGERILTSIETAEMIKYAANVALATKISFANTIAMIASRVGADAILVLEAVGLDRRIGPAFLAPGVGFGGSCLPKDTRVLFQVGKQYNLPLKLIKAVSDVNEDAKKDFVEKVKKLVGKTLKGATVGILGLSFKPNTDDMRDAPSIYIIKKLQSLGAKIRAYDPAAMENAKIILRDVIYCGDPYEAAKFSDILLILTEWNEFKELDFSRIRRVVKNPIILDGRNIYDRQDLESLGFKYQGVGR